MQNQVGRSLDADLSGGSGNRRAAHDGNCFSAAPASIHDDQFCHWPLRRAFSTIVAWFG